MKHPLLLAPLLCGSLHAASVTVDWLSLQSGGNPSSIVLLADGGFPTATGNVGISSGSAFFTFPKASTLSGTWTTPTGFEDTALGNQTVAAVEMRVAPGNGLATYQINLSVPANTRLVLAIGDLFRDSSTRTTGVSIFAQSDASSYTPLLDGIHGYSGTRVFDQDLAWDPATQFLATQPASSGESKMAFFIIPPMSGSNPRITLQVPNGVATGSGEIITFAVGIAIPEPSTLLLAAIAPLALLRRSRSLPLRNL